MKQLSSTSAALLLFILSFAVYSNTLAHQFTVDDVQHVTNNIIIRKVANLPEIFLRATNPGNLYRPAVIASYTLTYAAVKLDPWFYHFTNVLIHCGTTILVFFIVLALEERKLAFLAALIFAVHPIHTEAVANVANRTELFSSFFGCLSLWLFLCRDRRINQIWERLDFMLLAGLTLFIALLSKESSFCFFLLLPLCYYQRHGLRLGFHRAAPALIVMFGYAALYFGLRIYALSGLQLTEFGISYVDNPLVNLSFSDRLLNALVLLGKYLSLNFVPLILSADYSYAKTQPIGSLLEPTTLAYSILFCLFLLLTLYGLLKRSSYSIFCLWFLLAFSITANIVVVIGTVFGERLSYLASVGTCVLLAMAFLRIQNLIARRAVVGLLLILFSFQTVVRNRDWYDNMTLAKSEILVSGESVRANLWLGHLLQTAGKLRLAEKYLLKARHLSPTTVETTYELAKVEFLKGNKDKAVSLLYEAITLAPDHTDSLILLAHHYREEADFPRAQELFEQVLQYNSEHYEAILGLFAIAIKEQDFAAARHQRLRLVELDPDNPTFTELDIRYQRLVKKNGASP